MIPKYKEIFDFVVSNNVPVTEVKPMYKILVQWYDKEEVIYTENVSIVNNIKAPGIEITIENKEEYEKYHIDLHKFTERSEYIWYLLLKEEWKNLSEDAFESCYKNCWDKYHKEGGWDLVAEKMESVVKENHINT